MRSIPLLLLFTLAAPLAAQLDNNTPKTTARLHVVGQTPVDTAVADLDGDGNQDIATLDEDSSGNASLTALLLDAGGAATATSTFSLVGSRGPVALASAALDADGIENDLVATSRDTNTLVTVRGAASATPTVTTLSLLVRAPTDLAAARLAGNTPVLAIAAEGEPLSGGGGMEVRVGSNPAVVLASQGAKKFNSVRIVDLDNDGTPDIAGLEPGIPSSVFLWRGSGSGASTSYVPAGSVQCGSSGFEDALDADDVDGDGDIDLSCCQNDLLGGSVQLQVLESSGAAPLSQSGYSARSPLTVSGAVYVSRWRWANLLDRSIPGHTFFRDAAFCDRGRGTVGTAYGYGGGGSFSTVPGVVFAGGGSGGRLLTSFVGGGGSGRVTLLYPASSGPLVEVTDHVAYPFADAFGTGCGAATVATTGSTRLGSAFSFDVATSPRTLVAYFAAADNDNLALGSGCTKYVGSTLFCSFLRVSDGAGRSTLPMTTPTAAAALGARVTFQAAAVRPGAGAYLGTLDITQGLQVTVGDCN